MKVAYVGNKHTYGYPKGAVLEVFGVILYMKMYKEWQEICERKY